MTDFDVRKEVKKFDNFGDFIAYCADLVKNESWETRKEMFEKLYYYNADYTFWEEGMMFECFTNNNDEWKELYDIVLHDFEW